MAFMRLEEASRTIGTSVHTLRMLAKAGRLPGARKVGGRWVVHSETLEAYFRATLRPAELVRSETAPEASR